MTKKKIPCKDCISLAICTTKVRAFIHRNDEYLLIPIYVFNRTVANCELAKYYVNSYTVRYRELLEYLIKYKCTEEKTDEQHSL